MIFLGFLVSTVRARISSQKERADFPFCCLYMFEKEFNSRTLHLNRLHGVMTDSANSGGNGHVGEGHNLIETNTKPGTHAKSDDPRESRLLSCKAPQETRSHGKSEVHN